VRLAVPVVRVIDQVFAEVKQISALKNLDNCYSYAVDAEDVVLNDDDHAGDPTEGVLIFIPGLTVADIS